MHLGDKTRRTSSISCAACNSVCPRFTAPGPFPLANWIRALREAPLEHAFCDPVLEDLDRAAGDHPATAAAHAVLDQFLLRVAEPAHHLQRFVGDLVPRLIAERLGDRGLLRRRESAVGARRGPVKQELPGVELHFHLGELPLKTLEFAQQAPELLALHRPLPRSFVGVTAERERARRVADPLDVEARDLLLETAFLEDDAVGG